jgi:hypothetical protein
MKESKEQKVEATMDLALSWCLKRLREGVTREAIAGDKVVKIHEPATASDVKAIVAVYMAASSNKKGSEDREKLMSEVQVDLEKTLADMRKNRTKKPENEQAD